MVAATAVGVTAIVMSGGAATPAVVAAAAEGVAAGATATAAAATGTVTTGVAVAGATGTAAAAGACTGAAAGSTVGSAVVGAVVGSSTAAGVSATGSGAAAAVTTGFALGPVGWICLGAAENDKDGSLSFDCWKPVLHDKSKEPSNGKLLKDVLFDERIKEVEYSSHDNDGGMYYPEIVIENIWKEKFQIHYVILPRGELAAHAVAL